MRAMFLMAILEKPKYEIIDPSTKPIIIAAVIWIGDNSENQLYPSLIRNIPTEIHNKPAIKINTFFGTLGIMQFQLVD